MINHNDVDENISIQLENHRKIFIDPKEMSELTGIHIKQFYNYLDRGKLPYLPIGKSRFVLRSVFKVWALATLDDRYKVHIPDMKIENIVESIMTVDPGKGGTGVAIWDKERWDAQCNTFHRVLYKEPYYNASFRFNEDDALYNYYMLFNSLLRIFRVQHIIIEKPSYFSSEKGQVTANSGKLITLAMICGAYHAVATLNGISCEFIDVAKWKGQLTKELVKYRILSVSPDIKATNHDWDAIGIGLKKMGLINRDIK